MNEIRGDVIRQQIHDFLSDGNSNVCQISHRLRDIRETSKMLYEDHGQGEEEQDLRYSSGNVRIHVRDFFPQNLRKLITYTETVVPRD